MAQHSEHQQAKRDSWLTVHARSEPRPSVRVAYELRRLRVNLKLHVLRKVSHDHHYRAVIRGVYNCPTQYRAWGK
jgi:hypothetical protein